MTMASQSSPPPDPSPLQHSTAIDIPAVLHSDDAAGDSNLARLRNAEREIAYVRWAGMLFWLIVLLSFDPATLSRNVWMVYFSCLAFTALVQLRLRSAWSSRTDSWLTMIGDPLLAASMCSVTGGIESVFVPFLYFTTLAAAFRFGIRETLVILGLNVGLSGLLYLYASPSTPASTLLITLYYNGMAAAIGTMFAGWARSNLALAENRSRALHHAHASIRSLLHRLINAQEAERKHIADDLHDRMGGRLFTLQQGIESCQERIEPASPLAARLSLLAQETRACADDVRLLMNELRPTILDDLGIAETLGEFVTNMAPLVPFDIQLDMEPALRKWRSRQDALLFRLVQEAVLNVRKHAMATRLRLNLAGNPDSVTLCIADDGVGFTPAAVPSGHYGLLTMRERAEALGGSLEISSAAGQGTRITVQLPR